MDEITGLLVIIPEEDNIPTKFNDHHLPDNHVSLLKRFTSDLSLPNSLLCLEGHCSKKFLVASYLPIDISSQEVIRQCLKAG